jgi:hypothetical protein
VCVCVCLSVIVAPVQWPGRLQVHSFSSTDLVLVLMDPFLGRGASFLCQDS